VAASALAVGQALAANYRAVGQQITITLDQGAQVALLSTTLHMASSTQFSGAYSRN
jgi:hypothetical protein